MRINEFHIMQAVSIINGKRKENKSHWYMGVFNLNGNIVEYKGFNTWLQRLTVNGIEFGNCVDSSVREFRQTIVDALTTGSNQNANQ